MVKPRRNLGYLLLVLPLFFAGEAIAQSPPQIVGYVFPQNSLLQPGQVDPHSVTRLNYAFANIQDGRIVAGFANDAANFALLDSLRRQNPSLTILVSVGGWQWSGGFSDVALTTQSRDRFVQSVITFLNLYHLDGLDVDWEYPGMAGAGHIFRREDKHNFTLMLKGLRQRFDRETKRSGKRLYLTIAAGASDEFLAHTEMAEVARVVDTVNLMTYDYYEPGDGPLTGHHAPLFANPGDPLKVSADGSVKAFEQAGVPAGKILLGIPFYGHVWIDVTDRAHGLYQAGKPGANGYAPFAVIESSMLSHGFTRYWDPVSLVPWLFNPEQHSFVSYEDEQSIAAKCEYVRDHKLGGVMFWELENDDAAGKLLKTINESLR